MSRRRLAAGLGLAGGALGVLAGVVQTTAGSRIPAWSGAKAAPVPLGLLTVGLSVLAGLAALALRQPARSVRARAACALGLAGPGLLCLTTVGRLWYLPAALLLAAGALAVAGWRDTAAALARDWTRILLSALGGCELLMAAGAAPAVTATGLAGGIALAAAAWLPPGRRGTRLALVAAGTVPFAALAWTAVVPVLLALLAAAVAAPMPRNHPPIRAPR